MAPRRCSRPGSRPSSSPAARSATRRSSRPSTRPAPRCSRPESATSATERSHQLDRTKRGPASSRHGAARELHGDARAAAEPRGLTPADPTAAECPSRASPNRRRASSAASEHLMPTERRRYYLTTAIAYANNKPGLHTLFEVIGADAIARWHRMLGDDTRFLTGTDEHSVNIAQQSASEGRHPRDFVDEKVGLFKAAEASLQISPDRFIRTTDADH